MKGIFSRFTGFLLILVALLTWIVAIAGIIYIWGIAPAVKTALNNETGSVSSLLDSTSVLISGVSGSLEQAEEKMTIISTTGSDMAAMVDTTANISADMAKLSHTDLTSLVTSMQTSLKSMETTAKLVDDTLGLLSFVPFISNQYKPATPLNVAVDQVSHDMDNLPTILDQMSTNMNTATTNLATIKNDIFELVSSMQAIQTNLDKIKQTMQDYQTVIGQAQASVTAFHKNLNAWINTLAWLLTGILVWVAFTQVSGFIQGLALIR